jgi:hypothetical protein
MQLRCTRVCFLATTIRRFARERERERERKRESAVAVVTIIIIIIKEKIT